MESVIREGALRLCTTEASCDVILSCQDRRLMAHKLILSIASPVFRALLVESVEPAVVILPDISSHVMGLVLDYVYTGSVVVYSGSLGEFLGVVRLFQIHLDLDGLGDGFSLVKKKEEVKGGIEGSLEDEDVFSRGTRRKMPSLLPLTSLQSNRVKIRKMCGYVVPSPWRPRVEPVLEGPGVGGIAAPPPETQIRFSDKVEENDSNNNNSFRLGDVLPVLPRFFPNHDPINSLYGEGFVRSKEQGGSKLEKCKFKPILLASPKEKVAEEEIKEVRVVAVNGNEDEKAEVNEKDKDKKKKPFKCEDCGKTFSQLRNFKYHRSVHEGTKEFAAKCPECGKVFNDRGYLSSHMKIHRDRKEYACPHCPKRFNQRVAYNMHLRIHTGVKPHECSTCGKTFSRKMLLKQHQRVHTGERPYSCPECGKTFADRSNMSLHARLHTGVKPYACNLCPKSFTKKHHLKTHMNFHTGLKPYTCQKCGLAFSQSSNMRTHYKKCILKNTPIVANAGNEDKDDRQEC